jgi:hypothetical protein
MLRPFKKYGKISYVISKCIRNLFLVLVIILFAVKVLKPETNKDIRTAYFEQRKSALMPYSRMLVGGVNPFYVSLDLKTNELLHAGIITEIEAEETRGYLRACNFYAA